ncbi:DUF4175 domain-containing protein [Curvivirga aplysinae]|uniref:DUF4175 domain-containing protein n=1 Tax=Curvivirga aplysinae TaxID=2529852 RepID=UPI0012BD5482|nr:DUF4175 family protein [Curvivirga aplysinae]MTI08816.1 DUF4175 family protein [Curvivirga aplysinae]
MRKHVVRNFVGPVNIAVTWLVLMTTEFIKHGRFALLFLSLWLCLALSPLPNILSGIFLNIISYGLIAAFLYTTILFIRNVTIPSFQDILKAIEDNNELENRPLRSLNDNLSQHSIAQRETKQLWQLHQKNLLSDLPKLSPGWGKPIWVTKDPFALRFLCLFLLVIFATANNKPLKQILLDSLLPTNIFPPSLPLQIDGWITPPDYTRMPTTLLEINQTKADEQTSNVTIFPVQSNLVLQVNNSNEIPELYIDGIKIANNFKQLTSNSFRLATDIEQGGPAELRVDDEPVAKWNFRLIPDLPPEINFKGQISYTNRKSLRIPFIAMDDYGIKQIDLRLTRNSGQHEFEKILQLPLIESNGQKRDLSSSHFIDLTAHPWAGLQVKAELLITDAIDQIGSSLSQIITLPQRAFTNPVARQIIAIRRSVALSNSPEEMTAQAIRTASLAEKSDAYEHDQTVYMTLHIAARRLNAIDRIEHKQNSMRLLWDIALYLEEGAAIANLGKLQAAEQDLMDALNRGASDQEIDRLMQALEQAMAEYMQALARDLQSNDAPKTGLQKQIDASRMMDSKSIQDMMEQLRELLKMGMMDAARDLLSDIQNIMENLQMAEEEDLPESTMQAVEMIQDIEEIMKKQQHLMERSYNRAMGRNSDSSQIDHNETQNSLQNMQAQNPEDIAEQAALAKQLKQLREEYKQLMQQDAPQSFIESEEAMGAAKHSLEQGDNHQASDLQGKAIDALQQALSQMEESIIERFMNSNQQSISSETSPQGKGRDPFGRNMPNPLGTNSEGRKIPNASQMGRAQSIQQELRRRYNDKSREEDELDYIKRLLKPF